jgi:drug/metabolite transporter (DMT)-like permease
MIASTLSWLWIPITICAALCQTMRNAAQRHLTGALGTLGATLIRFLYGIPFSLAWLAALAMASRAAMPAPNARFALAACIGAASQLIGTALLLRAMAERNFAIGVAYSKTEILQVAFYSFVILAEPVSIPAALAIALGTGGVLLLSPRGESKGLGWLVSASTSPAALFGLGSGAAFAIAAVGYRAAALALHGSTPFIAAAYAVAWAQVIQSLGLGAWLLGRNPRVVRAVLGAWRLSFAAGCAGALASIGWFTAFALEPVAHVRTLGLTEVLFSAVVSWQVFRERMGMLELTGLGCLVLGVGLIALSS